MDEASRIANGISVGDLLEYEDDPSVSYQQIEEEVKQAGDYQPTMYSNKVALSEILQNVPEEYHSEVVVVSDVFDLGDRMYKSCVEAYYTYPNPDYEQELKQYQKDLEEGFPLKMEEWKRAKKRTL